MPRSSLLASLLLLAGACAAHDPARSGPMAPLVQGSLESGGRARSFRYVAPPGEGPFPLVLALHGRLGDGAGQDKLSHFARIATREAFVVVFPDGIDRSWNDARHLGPAADQNVDDVGFLSALIDLFIREHRADPARVYVTGMSNGAMMAHTAGCALAHQVAAIAPVTGNFPQALVESCQPSRPVSVALFLGTEDPLVPYGGGSVARDRGEVLSAEDSAATWARLDGCTSGLERTEEPDADPGDGTTITRARWSACREGAEVVLYGVRGGGHTWPGGWAYLGERWVGRTSRDLDASERIWEFFRDHRR